MFLASIFGVFFPVIWFGNEMVGATSLIIHFPFMLSIQDNAYWSTNMNAYKFGFFVPGRTSYYSPYEVNDN
jgi:hypothetical protein